MPQHYLGIDVGTTAVKALVVDDSGSVVGDAESPQELSVPQPDGRSRIRQTGGKAQSMPFVPLVRKLV